MRKMGLNMTFDELYLYCIGKDKLTVNDIYTSLTLQSNTINSTQLNYIVSNILGLELDTYKEEYEINDLQMLNLEEHTDYFKPLGEKTIL